MTKVSSGSNRREFRRSKTDIRAEIIFEDAAGITGRVTDVSLKGVFVECAAPREIGIRCAVKLLMGAAEGLCVRISGRVARDQKSGIGIEFSEVDLENLLHLKNLILYNSRHPSLVSRELKESLGLKKGPPRHH